MGNHDIHYFLHYYNLINTMWVVDSNMFRTFLNLNGLIEILLCVMQLKPKQIYFVIIYC